MNSFWVHIISGQLHNCVASSILCTGGDTMHTVKTFTFMMHHLVEIILFFNIRLVSHPESCITGSLSKPA